VVRYGRKVVVAVIGTTVILFGIAIVFLPGPGPIIVIPLGIAILAAEFEWARRVKHQIQETVASSAVEARARKWVRRRRTVRP
jgi:uncharacterized protein (TIGR02611 family)